MSNKLSLSQEVSRMKSAIHGISSNETLNCFDDVTCQLLDQSNDGFLMNRTQKCAKALSDLQKIDYDDRIKSAFDDYNEALVYYTLKYIKCYDIQNITETKTKTPDFTISYNSDDFFVEMKSLAFGDGNLGYKKAMEESVEANISIEEQRKKGKRICSSIRTIRPFNCKDAHDQLTQIYRKIDNNIKGGQFLSGDTVLLVDLTQITLGLGLDGGECFSSYPGASGCLLSGMLWNLAFGKVEHLYYINPEFDGKPNISDNSLGFDGLLHIYNQVKGIIFSFGTSPETKQFYGLFRRADTDKPWAIFIQDCCTYYNDEYDSYRYLLQTI